MRISEDLSFEAEFTLPNGAGPAAIEEGRIARLGGDCAADHEFRAELYRAIGRVTVASGHVEAAMMRVIRVVDSDGSRFGSLTRDNWTALGKRLEGIATSDHPLACKLADHLERAAQDRLKQKRDDIVHGYWWHWAGVGVTMSRYLRDGTTRVITSQHPDVAGLDGIAASLFELAEDLDRLVESKWPQVRLLGVDTPIAE